MAWLNGARRRALAFSLVSGLALSAAANLAVAAPTTTVDRNGSYVSVETYAPNVIRVTISQDKDLAKAAPGYGINGAPSDKGWRHDQKAGADIFTSSDLSLEVVAQPWPGAPSLQERYFAPSLPPVSIKVRKADGTSLVDMEGWEMSPHVVSGEKTYRAGATFSTTHDEHFYGLGQNQEQETTLDLRGRTVDCKHDYDAPHGETVCVPFLVTSKGYGILWDNPSATKIYPGVNGRTLWQSNVGERVSFFVITGKTTDEIYAGYRALTGVTPLPPKAAFGYIQSKARYESQAEFMAVADGYQKRQLPLDIMVLDWFHWTRMGQIDIDPKAFPDPAGMNKTLHDRGVETIISVWPRFEQEGRYFNYMADKGYFLRDADGKVVDGLPFRSDRTGALIDTTNPEAREWFWGKIRDNILSQGFDWLWLDETEPDLVPSGFFFHAGSGDRIRNAFPLMHAQLAADGSRRDRPDKRNLILARAAYTGAQRNGSLFWSSDIKPTWETLKRQVPTGLNFTASGLAYWGNDIGGWQWLPQTTTATKPPLLNPSDARDVVGQNNDYPELFTRWFQYGVFTPTLRVHGMRKEAELWSFGKEAEAVLTKYVKLRYALMPYLYSMGKTTYDTGAPFMRGLFMDFPNDPKVANIGDQYMFGPAFLVAPVTDQGVTERDVYLPAGADWYDYWTNQKYTGGQTVHVKAPIDTIPLFVRAGSIVPMGAPILNTRQTQALSAVKVWPGADAEFSLYDDDGVTNAYEKGVGKTVKLRWDDKAGKLTATGDKALAAQAQAAVQVVK
ncbi:glycoside hydrolase family 31 protein [Caulobacter hibisci]|uniref:Glycoside hydrolase family 31 protein n=1 Tax=Caulobacter hibisci TaxID=2035993 RepID=A0ABS0SSJ8_9CAUL|nr:glycoside hydrolase family 31 protein [Caulobacter hibisci]MBI1682617.1 glycoside hydrolase family 31 protein [Caulobacter hibisci]